MVADMDEPDPTPPADLVLGAFSDHPPWLVRPEEMRWRIGLDRVRARTKAEVPDLTRSRLLPPAGRLLATVRQLGVPVGVWAALER